MIGVDPGVCVPVCGTRRCALTTVFSESYQFAITGFTRSLCRIRARDARGPVPIGGTCCAAHRAIVVASPFMAMCSWHRWRCDVGVRETRDQTNFSIAAMWASLIVRIDFVRARRV